MRKATSTNHVSVAHYHCLGANVIYLAIAIEWSIALLSRLLTIHTYSCYNNIAEFRRLNNITPVPSMHTSYYSNRHCSTEYDVD